MCACHYSDHYQYQYLHYCPPIAIINDFSAYYPQILYFVYFARKNTFSDQFYLNFKYYYKWLLQLQAKPPNQENLLEFKALQTFTLHLVTHSAVSYQCDYSCRSNSEFTYMDVIKVLESFSPVYHDPQKTDLKNNYQDLDFYV